MAVEAAEFQIGTVVWKYQMSKEMRPDPERVLVGITSMPVRCGNCGHSWVSGEHGEGRFLAAIGGDYHLKCPTCKAQGSVNMRDLK